MAKRKADTDRPAPLVNGSKKAKHEAKNLATNLLDDSDSASSDESDGGAKLEEPGFRINDEYAKRFEHNKKREELQRLEEKYEKPSRPTHNQNGDKKYGDKYDEDSESSDDEDEDDDGELVTEELDADWLSTYKAVKNRDPAIYKKEIEFFKPIEEEDENVGEGKTIKKEKPMYLRDYHRENLLRGQAGAEEDGEDQPRTYAQGQEDLKKIVREMHVGVSEDEDEDFLVAKSKPEPESSSQGIHPSRARKVKLDAAAVAHADKDPENFLSNFMAARAWVPSGESRFQPLESDDDEEDQRAEKFEAAYNLRFEDPSKSNETLKAFSRQEIATKTVRRDEVSGRKKQRDAAREKREAEKQEREEERAQLRRLKIEEMEEKLQKIKKAAGTRGKTLKDEDFAKFLDNDWDDAGWEAEMNKRFGEEYYAENETDFEDGSDAGDKAITRKKTKKPTWDDDIAINDLIPDFEDEHAERPAFDLSDLDLESEDDGNGAPRKAKNTKDRQAEKKDKKKAARLERKKIEDLVDSRMDIDLPTKSKQPVVFRYRETSPTSFGLTANDILMASDQDLNQFAGLKKMASFRDAEKKRKDKKHLGKKARLRQWRKETFGNEDGPEIVIGANAGEVRDAAVDEDNVVEGNRRQKKRSRKNRAQGNVEA